MRIVLLLLGLACCSFRDDFAGPDGPLRYPWSGADTSSFVIESGALRSVSGVRSLVHDSPLPNSQVAWARWTGLGGTEHDILLRCQGTSFPTPHIEVRYDNLSRLLRVATYNAGAWTTRATWNRTFAVGDTLIARVDSVGLVTVWHNQTQVGSVSTASWPYAQSPGRAGVTMSSGAGRLDWFAASVYPVPPASETIPPSAILSWTFPTHQVGPDGCEAGATLERALCGFVIEARPDTVGGQWACAWRGAWGKPGEVGRVGLPMDGVAQWFRIAAIDSAGNQTPCWSNETRVP